MCRLVVFLALGALVSAAVAGAAANPANQAALDRTVRYLQEAQQANGGFAAAGEPSQIVSAWTALALAAAGINPQDQARLGGADAFAYLDSHYQQGVEESECAPIACTTVLERELMVVNASGADPHWFGGVDLVEQLLGRARGDGSFPHVPGGQAGVNDTIFAIFALAPIGEPAAEAAVAPAAGWVAGAQHDNGGWAFTTGARDEVDMTGAAIQALVAAGQEDSAAVRKGLDYLRAAQNPDGGFPEYPGNAESNVASTAWAVQAIWAAGENPASWRTASGAEPLAYMESLQEPDGHVRWKRSQDLNGIWMTAYTTPALAGHPWPIPRTPRSDAAVMMAKPGQGEGIQAGDGVIAGGGGRGAALFSRPKPQSKGRAPGGERVVHRNAAEAESRRRARRAESEGRPIPASASEAMSAHGEKDAAAGSLRRLATAGAGAGGSGAGQKVTGALIGSLGSASGRAAPGLHGAGDDDEETAVVAIGSAALLLALGGAGWERRRQETVL